MHVHEQPTKRHNTYPLNTLAARQNLGGLYLSQVEELDDEHTDSLTANIDSVWVMPEIIPYSP